MTEDTDDLDSAIEEFALTLIAKVRRETLEEVEALVESALETGAFGVYLDRAAAVVALDRILKEIKKLPREST